MRKDYGFALIVTLWLITALGIVTGIAFAAARAGSIAAGNRMLLRRAEWAREACLAILSADSTSRRLRLGRDSVDLGNHVWCSLQVTPDADHLNINLVTREQLRALVHDDSLADAILDWRDTDEIPMPLGTEQAWYREQGRAEPRNGPFLSVAEVALVRGVTAARVAALEGLLTTRGDGRVSLAAAPLQVLAVLPGITKGAVAAAARARSQGKGPASVEELIGLLEPADRADVMAHFAELKSATTTDLVQRIDVQGAVGASPLRASARVVAVRLPERLAIIGRESW